MKDQYSISREIIILWRASSQIKKSLLQKQDGPQMVLIDDPLLPTSSLRRRISELSVNISREEKYATISSRPSINRGKYLEVKNMLEAHLVYLMIRGEKNSHSQDHFLSMEAHLWYGVSCKLSGKFTTKYRHSTMMKYAPIFLKMSSISSPKSSVLILT